MIPPERPDNRQSFQIARDEAEWASSIIADRFGYSPDITPKVRKKEEEL